MGHLEWGGPSGKNGRTATPTRVERKTLGTEKMRAPIYEREFSGPKEKMIDEIRAVGKEIEQIVLSYKEENGKLTVTFGENPGINHSSWMPELENQAS